jgi:hypothetical protein
LELTAGVDLLDDVLLELGDDLPGLLPPELGDEVDLLGLDFEVDLLGLLVLLELGDDLPGLLPPELGDEVDLLGLDLLELVLLELGDEVDLLGLDDAPGLLPPDPLVVPLLPMY